MPRTASAIGPPWSSPSTSTGEDAGDRPSRGAVRADRPGPSALQELRQFGEDGGRIALGGRRVRRPARPTSRCAMAKRWTLSIRHSTSMSGSRRIRRWPWSCRRPGRALQRRFVGGGDHHDGAPVSSSSPRVSSMNPASSRPPLVDQPDDDSVAVGVLGQHGKQHRLADAGAGEDAEPLAAAAGGEHVHGPDAEVQTLAHPGAGMGGFSGAARSGQAASPGSSGPLPSMGLPNASTSAR